MTEVSRFIEVDAQHDYVVPVITLGDYERSYRTVTGYSFQKRTGAVHVGIDKGEGKVACFCGQHHKQESVVWKSPSIETAPDITCKMCLKTMRKLIRGSASPYQSVIEALGQKLVKAQFHERQEGKNNNSTYVPGMPEEVSRILKGPDQTPIFLKALNQGVYPTQHTHAPIVHTHAPIRNRPIDEVSIDLELAYKVILIKDYSGYNYRCHKCCFNGPRPCPTNRYDIKFCETVGCSAYFIEVLTTPKTKR